VKPWDLVEVVLKVSSYTLSRSSTKETLPSAILGNPQLDLPLSLACTTPTFYLPRYSVRISSASLEIQVNAVPII
jgi:hypothetical protein